MAAVADWFVLGAAFVLGLLGAGIGLLVRRQLVDRRREPQRLDLSDQALLSIFVSGAGSGYGASTMKVGVPPMLAQSFAETYVAKLNGDLFADPALRHELLTRLHAVVEAIETGDPSKVPPSTVLKKTRGDQ